MLTFTWFFDLAHIFYWLEILITCPNAKFFELQTKCKFVFVFWIIGIEEKVLGSQQAFVLKSEVNAVDTDIEIV